MNYFKKFFPDVIDWDREEVAVLCPFPHSVDGYKETRQSAHINTEKGVYHCKACGKGLSEVSFCAEVENIEYTKALQLVNLLETETNVDSLTSITQDQDLLKLVKELEITDDVIKECKLSIDPQGLAIPVLMYDTLLDLRVYNIYKKENQPKVKSLPNSLQGLIIPFDVWVKDTRPTVLCAGEKDMLVCRSKGFNAITLTGGERAKPNELVQRQLKNKTIYVVYDNDTTGIDGGESISAYLLNLGATVYNVTMHHLICSENHEDIADFFLKYKQTTQDLQDIFDSTSAYTHKEAEKVKSTELPLISLKDALDSKYRNKYVRSIVQVTSSFETPYGFADVVECSKGMWELTDYNIQQLLYLVECNVNTDKQTAYYKSFLGLDKKDDELIKKLHYTTVYRATLADFREVDDGTEIEHRELECYILKDKLQNGKVYTVTYKVVPHPLKSQIMVMMLKKAEVSDDSVSTFIVDEGVKNSLNTFKNLGDTPDVILKKVYNSTKALIAPHLNHKIWMATDSFYHTPLQFNYADTTIRGYLDTMIIGETRTGKSETAKGLLHLYNLGHFISLKTSTTTGLIGGSKAVNGGYKNTVGAIPRNHKRAVIMEEFSGADPSFIKTMTDVKSSNVVRIVRVDGELQVPCFVRMLTLSNQRATKDGVSKPLMSYPNGIEVLLELVGAGEDIARYDMFVLVPEPEDLITPFSRRGLGEPIPQQAYQDRVRWVWSRTPEQILFDNYSDEYIWETAQELNKNYNCHIKIFGTEAHLKLARMSVAIAGMCCSTDDTYENIIVKKEHIDYARDFMVSLYDNDIFRLKEYVDSYKAFNEFSADDIDILTEQFFKFSPTLLHLESVSEVSSKNLQMASGLDNDMFRNVISLLTSRKFIIWSGDKVIPSGKFRKAMKQIDRITRPQKKVV